ncbi:MAG: helix-turn-helix domain-containing protein [Desulfotomaculum sp.]|nr:helix-turn-helix domain-containing protein [Desulfotomaculum sp.]
MVKERSELPMVLTVEQTAKVMGLNRGTVYELIRQKQLPAAKIGRRILVPRDALFDWLYREAAGSISAN